MSKGSFPENLILYAWEFLVGLPAPVLWVGGVLLVLFILLCVGIGLEESNSAIAREIGEYIMNLLKLAGVLLLVALGVGIVATLFFFVWRFWTFALD